MISVAIYTDCKVQESRATVGLRINAPLLMSKLPTSILTLNEEARQRAIEAEFGEPYMLQYHLYNALLGGLEYHRFFEWDSLELGGPLMTWVYTILLCASAMFSMSTAGIVLFLGGQIGYNQPLNAFLHFGGMSIQCRHSGARPEEHPFAGALMAHININTITVSKTSAAFLCLTTKVKPAV